MSKFDKIIPKGSFPNCQLQIANRYDNRWFKCKLKPPKNYSLEALGSHYRQYLNFAQIEVDCCVAPTLEEGEVDGNKDLEQLMSFVNSTIERYEW